MTASRPVTPPPRVKEIVDEIEPVGTPATLGLDSLEAGDWLLVEKNVGPARQQQSHWFSIHGTMQDATEYWLSQEYREDWQPELLVDLVSRAKYEPNHQLRWTESD